LWLRDAAALAQVLQGRYKFDLTHQLTYIGFRFPGYLWKLPLPFVWGPLGGLEQTNWRLLPALGWKGCLYYVCRNTINAFDMHCRLSVWRAMHKAGCGIIAATSGIREAIERLYGEKSEVICEIGLPPLSVSDKTQLLRRVDGAPLRLIWIGNCFPGKALNFLFAALPRLRPESNWRLDIFGSGPMQRKWQRQAARMGLSERVVWRGRVSREEVLNCLREAHLLTVTSVYDLTSTVVVEALANGVPVLCPDHCGFHDAVTDGCGIRFPAGNPKEFVTGLYKGVQQLHDNEELRERLACGALERAKDFEWEAKARRVSEIYLRKAEACPRQ
jgi:glycosyltransferase involved in cell wall biosynthesis